MKITLAGPGAAVLDRTLENGKKPVELQQAVRRRSSAEME